MNTSNSAIRKGLLSSCPRIGLSKKWRTNSFKSPLIEQKVTLNYNSPANETPTSSIESTPVTVETKRKSEALDQSNSKRAKRDTEPTRKAKKRLIDDDTSNDEVEKVNALNVSGCDLLTIDEKSTENVLTESEKVNEQNENKSPKVRELYVSVVKLSPDQLKLKENSKLNETKEAEKVGTKYEKLKQSSKNEIKPPERNQTKKIDNKKDSLQNNTDTMSFSPKTIVSQLETNPLLDPLDDSFVIKEKSHNKQSSKSKNSIDEYIKRKEKRKTNLSSSSSKLSMKKSSTNSDSLESDEELLEKPKVQKLNSQTKNFDKSDVIDKILQLEKVVSDKEGELERYKQAEVYHKIHDVKKLEGLTETWRNGCQNALQDLLLKLKEHGNIDMPGLLNRLGGSTGLISYDVENGVFT